MLRPLPMYTKNKFFYIKTSLLTQSRKHDDVDLYDAYDFKVFPTYISS